MNQFDSPIFIRSKDCGDVRRYSSLVDVQNHLEQIDVENEEYDAWDRKGNPLTLSVENPPTKATPSSFRAKHSDIWLRVYAAQALELPTLTEAIVDFAHRNDAVVDRSALERGDFIDALDQVISQLDERLKAMNWWERFRHRF